MKSRLISDNPPPRIQSFDEIIEHFSDTATSFSEVEALKASHWDMGEDARLREDIRFRQTLWGRWILSQSFLANDALYDLFLRELRPEMDLSDSLTELSKSVERRSVFCSADDRFVLSNGKLRLSAKELTGRPLIENNITDIEKFITHLPVHSLKAAAASEPAGEWGPNTQEQHIETLGWVRVSMPGRRKLNERMFVAQTEGHSMDDGRSGIVDGGYAVFELWPEGTRQMLNVLVRASFSDPETGSYAVKRYIGDIRNEEGQHSEIRLVSLNPDKERFPDIVVKPEDDVTVVAKLVQALSPEDFAREPKTPRRTGRRNLGEPTELSSRETQLRNVAHRFFNALHSDDEDEGLSTEWKARLVCLDAEAGGLCIETQPLSWLPPFSKLLLVTTQPFAPVVVIASNLKSRTWRTPVSPSVYPYCWSGRDDLLDEQLLEYQLPGLVPGKCKLFCVDAAGVGQEVIGNTITAGLNYRIIVPPEVHLPASTGDTDELVDGWKLWDFLVPSDPREELRKILIDLGYQLGDTAPIARWVLRSPVTYSYTPRGEVYPVFSPNRNPTLSIEGITSELNGELVLIAVGEHSSQSLFLPAGSKWIAELDDLQPGRYMLQVIPERTRVSPVSLPFAVTLDEDQYIPAQLRVTWEDGGITQTANGCFSIKGDISNDGLQESFHCEGPPLWSYEVSWNDGMLHRLGDIHGSIDGALNVEQLDEQLRDRVRACIASLSLDGAELGVVEFQHSHRLSFADLRSKLLSLFEKCGATAKNLDGQFRILRTMWIHPILELLGFNWKEPAVEDLEDLPALMTPIRLTTPHRDNRGQISRTSTRAMLITSGSSDFDSTDIGSPRRFADTLCERWQLSEVIITDGFRWAKHQHHAQWHLEIFHFREVLEEQESSKFTDFVRSFAHPSAVKE